ncbi:MAG: penicillin-binding protein [Polaribacter sp.]|jgi:cell division protein FtsI (penicillin-binding protein 3)|uniref:penicillin-binding protein n=1 Tax=unclassified Polaribacter TaxID=196858 RepID=UPI000B83B94F|nr:MULTISPECIES: penicillin-binding protein [unclassified Polaribacter]MBT3740998.1 transpeptidase family protein [Polaribacter sp.]MDG1195885.1 penicillin-binding protein [Polaribacter sp.]MDG1402561.1 penicillin-binding protein [Polaribacter sp.]MDG2436756.1 penicillin-binding protein [Polaribacter sp.]
MTLFLLAIIFRVVNIQYAQGAKYKKLATELTIKQDTIKANKGNVYAADGNLLATSMSKYTIRMDVVAVNSNVFENNFMALSEELFQMFGNSPEYYQNKLRKAKKRRNRYLLIARNVGYNDYLKMKKFPIFKLGVYRGGFIAEHKTVRAHPIGKIAERTIGYDDFRGEAGIEGAFADFMEGENGLRWKQKIAKNQWKPISDVNEKEPIDGHDVITTIDVNIQDITHHALLRQLEYFEADHGCAVVMETATGEIKAISNLGRTSKGKYFEKRNYALWESHEPGSTFKLASLMAALDDKVIDTSTVVDTEKGKVYIYNRKVEDSKRGGYGKISAARVFEVSSNVGIVKLIREHYDQNPGKFISKLEKYGFKKPIGFQIKGEGLPYIPNPKDKKRWSKISLAWMSWGYGVSVTPMQTLMFYNAVANNGVMVKPRFVKELRRQDKIEKIFQTEIVNSKIASDQTLKKIRKVMENVVIRGTAKNIYSSNFSMAGKTGTAKKYIPRHKNEKGETISGHYSTERYVASFAGFFPAEAPKYSCIVVVHDPNKKKGYYGATVAAPIFKEIAQKIYTTTPIDNQSVKDKVEFESIVNQYKKYTKVINKEHTYIPNVQGMSGMDAVSLLENIGLKVKITGVGKVKYQSIKKGETLVKGTTIILKLS